MNLLKELEESRLVNENPDRAAQDCDTKQLGGNSHNLQFALAWVEGRKFTHKYEEVGEEERIFDELG